MKEIFKLHGLSKAIILDNDVKFTSNFWKELFQELGTWLIFNKTYHPQIDGKTKRVNQVFEDMLHMYLMDEPSRWEYYLHPTKFSYNNGHQVTLNMSPFKALYGRMCRTPVNWDGPMNRVILGPKIIQEVEQQVVNIKQHLKVAQDRQKSYDDLKRLHKEFKVDDHVYLRVRQRKSSLKLGSCAKLAP